MEDTPISTARNDAVSESRKVSTGIISTPIDSSYCPLCGAPIGERKFESDDKRKHHMVVKTDCTE